MKQLPLIGRFQEKLATGPRDAPGSANGLAQNQAGWLLESVRRLAGHFLTLAEQEGLGPGKTEIDPEAPRIRALLLAYKLTLTALRRREPATDREVVTLVRSRMVDELEITSPQDSPAGPGRARTKWLDPADSDVAASVIRFEAGLPGPLAPFYGDLAPTFGGPCRSDQLAARYGKIVRHLYDILQKKLDERERLTATPVTISRYAGKGR